MKIFLLEPDSEKYQTFITTREDDDDRLLSVIGYPIGDKWVPIKVEPIIDEPIDSLLPLGDFSTIITPTFPMFSQKAVDSLKDILLPNGELLPLDFHGQCYYLFNVTRVIAALNLPDCDAVFFDDGRILAVRKYDFNPIYLRNSTIFKVPEFTKSPLFVSEIFVERVDMANLSGFKFRQVWQYDE